MKKSEAEIRKWVQIISDDYMHYTDEQKEYIISMAKYFDFETLPEDMGCIGWMCVKDFDCKNKMNVLILYCRPEGRGRYLRYMFRRLEEIAEQEDAHEIIIGRSISGYKEDKFNRMLEHLGFSTYAYSKRI